MPYIITRYSNDTSADPGWPKIINDGTIDSSLGINLLGRGKTNYGKPIAENFVRLLENFASNNPPTNAITGQLWYKVNSRDLYVCVSVSSSPVWQKIAKIHVSTSSPNTILSEGTLFLQNDTGGDILWISDGNEWIRINGVIVSNSIPSSARNGYFWYQPSTKTLRIFVDANWLPLITSNFNESGNIVITEVSGTPESFIKFVFNNDAQVVIASDDLNVSDYAGLHADVSANFPNGLKHGLNSYNIKIHNLVFESVEDNIIAKGTTPVSAHVLTKTNNFVTTASPTERGVRLPSASARAVGMIVNIWNLTSNTIDVYPPTGLTIEGLSTDTILSNSKKSYILRNLSEFRIR